MGKTQKIRVVGVWSIVRAAIKSIVSFDPLIRPICLFIIMLRLVSKELVVYLIIKRLNEQTKSNVIPRGLDPSRLGN